MRRPKKVSQVQLAKELGVSQALISLVLNGRRQGINPDTYDRIWAHAVERGYRPKGMHLPASPAARPRQIAVILRAPLRLHTPAVYFGHVQHGLHVALESRGFTAVFIGAEDQMDSDKIQRAFPAGHLFHGIALIGEVARPFLDELRNLGLRIVAISARYTGLCHSVIGNEPQALDAIVQHLVALGHKRIGWFGGNVGLGRHESRFQALEAALKRAGLPLDARYCVKLDQGDRAEGAEAVHRVLPLARRRDFPTAFVCYNTSMATGAIKALSREGLRVPGDISIASADFSPMTPGNSPRITAAGSDPEKLGEAAARLLLDGPATDDGGFTDLMLPAHLHVGDTTGAAKA